MNNYFAAIKILILQKILNWCERCTCYAIEGKTSKTAVLPGFGKLEHGAPPCCRGLLWLEHAWLGLLWSDNDLSKATTLNNTYTP